MKIFLKTIVSLLLAQQVFSQDCKTSADLDAVPGKYVTAAEYPWPAARAEYFSKLTSAADKAMARQTLSQIEKIEQQSHNGFNLTGGNWENYYSTEGYNYLGGGRLAQYSFRSALYEYFCSKGKSLRNSEYSTILQVYVNAVPLHTLSKLLQNPFGDSMGDYDLGFQYLDWKNHRSADVNARLISLFSYLSCNSEQLLEAINSGNSYFQDIPEKDIRPNNRNNYIHRYWFVKKPGLSVLLPVSRKEYLESLLEYYEREKLYFTQLMVKLVADHDNGVKQYVNWETDVTDKISFVKKAISEHTADWLQQQAVINRMEDASQTYKAQLKERTNRNRFWKFYDKGNKSEPLYKYNPAYFGGTAQGPAKPQLITISFRYVSVPSSLRILNNFTKNFDFNAVKRMVE